MKQLHLGRDEPILEPQIPIVDAHHHLFMNSGFRYLFDDYLRDIQAGHRVIASVYLEMMAFARLSGPEWLRPVGEVEFANGVGAMADSGAFGGARVCAAIVGYADMRWGDDVARLLDACIERAPERYRGIRQITIEHENEAPFAYIPVRPPTGVLESSAFRAAFQHLAPRGLIYDAAVFDHQLHHVADIADAFPDTIITLNHAGMPMGMGVSGEARRELFATWRSRLSEIAKRPNVYCKIGGLGLPFWGFGFEERQDPIGYLELAGTWRPIVETVIELFGTKRCLMESNYPADARTCGYVPLWNALKHITSAVTEEEKADLFWRTAARIHRIELAPELLS